YVPAISKVEAYRLVIRILPVETRGPDVAKPNEIGISRLIREHSAQLGLLVQDVAPAELEVQARAVHITVRVRQDRRGLPLQAANRAGIDVAIDADVEPDAEVEHEAGFISRLRLR